MEHLAGADDQVRRQPLVSGKDELTRSERPAPRVLIVDDDPVTVEYYARALKVEGFDVLTALDAAGALREAQRLRPDAAIVDLRMPSMDGLAFLRELADRCGGPIPAAIVTGDYLADDATLTEALALAPRIVFKPLWVEDLVELAKSLLKQRPQ